MAANAIKSAIPSHLKPGNGDSEAEFATKHHGKTRSHMVSLPALLKTMFANPIATPYTHETTPFTTSLFSS